ncbi:hypothetical protein EYF80_011916 [Liparis tanakae]|uniref:Uncharacterized protein n=1 Tax=Liparis tanakae TaxID=230148 RepID=A0A4Z2IIR1_9TELE|nr:hypothetical protein EYF80_011916 [Liparis tanakae]
MQTPRASAGHGSHAMSTLCLLESCPCDGWSHATHRCLLWIFQLFSFIIFPVCRQAVQLLFSVQLRLISPPSAGERRVQVLGEASGWLASGTTSRRPPTKRR